MALIYHYLILKLYLLFDPRKNIWGFSALIAMVFIAILYGKGFSLLTHGEIIQMNESVSEALKSGLAVFLALFTFTRGFFPSYKPVRSYFKRFHPINGWLKFILNYLSDFISLYFLTMGSFIISIIYFSPTIAEVYIYLLIVSLIGSHLARRSFQTVIENRISFSKSNVITLLIAITIFLISVVSFLIYQIPTALFITGVVLSFIIIAYTLEEKCDKEEGDFLNSKKTGVRNVSIDLLIKNKYVRTPLIFGYFFKIVILILDLFIYSKSQTHFGNNLIIIFLFASPLILFTYIFNNSWGYFKNYWFVIDQGLSNGKSIFKMYLYILWLPLSFDLVISISYFILTPSNILLEGLIMYFISLIILTLGGFFWSMFNPSRVEQGLSFKVNSSILGSITSIAIVSSFMLLFISSWFYLIIPIYLIISVGSYLWLTSKYRKKRFYIFQKVYKS